MKRSIILLSLVCSISFTGCNAATLITNLPDLKEQLQDSSSDSIDKKIKKAIFASAISKRALSIDSQQSQIDNSTSKGAVPAASPTAESTSESAVPQSDAIVDASVSAPDIARPLIAPAPMPAGLSIAPFPFYGSSDFNQYTVTFAEENLYPGSKAKSLLDVYQDAIKPILNEWDSEARLVESRGNLFQHSNHEKIEYVSIPGLDNEKPLKIRPDWVFRLASTPLKETLTIYVTQKETRVYRMVWGQPHVDIEKVKIDSDQAIEIAKKAFANRSKKTDFPIFPDFNRRGQEIVYDLPEQLNWRIQLNQQGSSLRYFLSFDYRENQAPTPIPEPIPLPAVEFISEDGVDISVAPSRGFPDIHYRFLSGSITIDAVSGKVKHLNRPVRYNFDRPEPLPLPVDPEPPVFVGPEPVAPPSVPGEPVAPPSIPGEPLPEPLPLPPAIAPDCSPIISGDHSEGEVTTAIEPAVDCPPSPIVEDTIK